MEGDLRKSQRACQQLDAQKVRPEFLGVGRNVCKLEIYATNKVEIQFLEVL